MSKISEARQALRDYAREVGDGARLVVEEPGKGRVVAAARGELAGKAFTAAQAALTVAEELREESLQQPVTYNDDKDLYAKREAANRIEAAILNALSL